MSFLALGSFSTPASATSTLVVDVDGYGSASNCNSAGAAYSTIQAAIDAAAPGGTISVCPGTYVETGQIVINKDLSIVGADKATTIIKPAQDTDSSGDPRGWFLVNDGITFNLSGVTLDGTGRKVWQAIRDKGQGTISDCAFKNISFEESGPSYGGWAVAVFGGPHMNVDITGCTFSGIGRVGVLYYGSGVTDSTFSGNTYTGKGDGNWLDYAVELSAGAQATITDNTISGTTGVASVDGSTSAGINISTYFGDGTQATISGNAISGCTVGIGVGLDASDTSAVTAHHNNLAGNTTGVDSTAPLVDATNNWWGSANGPEHASNTFNVGTQGDAVSDNVLFVPWLDDEPPDGASFAPVTTTNLVGSYASIQAGVNASNSTGTVNAKAGTYDEQVVIGKSLTVQGAGDTTVIKPSSAAKLTTVLEAHYWGGLKEVAGILVANVADGSSVTVKNLKVDGDGVTAKPAGADFVAGIFYRETGGTVDRVTATNTKVGATGTAVRGYGVFVTAGDNTVSVEVKNSTVANYDKNGIEADGSTLTTNIHDNTVTGRGPLPNGDEVQNGILIGDGAVGTVDSNTVSDNFYAPETWWGAAIMFFDAGGPAEGNTLTDNQIGVIFVDGNASANNNTVSGGKDGVYAEYDTPGTWTASFADNTVSGSDTCAIGGATYAEGASLTLTIANNALTGGTGDGVCIGDLPEYDPAGSVAATITGNAISGWQTGISVSSSAATTVARFNLISGNASYGAQNTDSSAKVDAINNWWGSNSGPSNNGQSCNTATGSGDKVSCYVLFDPWFPPTVCPGDVDCDGVPDQFDNCPNVYNPDQLNTDAKPIDNGPGVPGDDFSVPNADVLGDACDADVDNDWMLNTGTYPILGTQGEDVGCGSGRTNPTLMDSDGDTVVDGYECLARTDPNSALSKPSGGAIDSDHDGIPDRIEALFGSDPHKSDTDGDGIPDAIEIRGWATSPILKDTNFNGCPDNVEIADVNGDYWVNTTDLLLVARAVGHMIGYNADIDVMKDGTMNITDLLLVARQVTKSCTRP